MTQNSSVWLFYMKIFRKEIALDVEQILKQNLIWTVHLYRSYNKTGKITIWKLNPLQRYTLIKQRLKITQLEKVRFIKVNELKLTQVVLF